jgi:hypothetical protein
VMMNLAVERATMQAGRHDPLLLAARAAAA